MTAEETLASVTKMTVDEVKDAYKNRHYMVVTNCIEAMRDHTNDALTAYRAEVLSAIEKGEDILKIDIEKFGR